MSFLSGRPRAQPQRKISEPTYEVPDYDPQPVKRYLADIQPNIYGPHFQKAPQHVEISERRAGGKNIPRDHPDLHGRAYTFGPRLQHKYSDPYKKTPEKWTKEMVAERIEYHAAGDLKSPQERQNDIDIKAAGGLRVGERHPFQPENGPILQAGIAAIQAKVTRANIIGQQRDGFAHKYPQAYEDENALERHNNEIRNRQGVAIKARKAQALMETNYAKWAAQAQKHG